MFWCRYSGFIIFRYVSWDGIFCVYFRERVLAEYIRRFFRLVLFLCLVMLESFWVVLSREGIVIEAVFAV